MFAAQGYEGTSVRDIADEAGHTTGAIYAHFAAKEDLFLALLEERYDRKITELERLVSEASDINGAIDNLRNRFEVLQRGDAEWELLATEFWLFAARHPNVRPNLAALHQRLREGIAELINNQLVANGMSPDADPLQLATLLIALGDGLGIQSRLDPTAVPTDLFAETIIHLALSRQP